MDLGLAGRKALVTGGTRGIGRACVRALAAEGAHVAFCGRSSETVDAMAKELGPGHAGFVVDLETSDGPARLADEVLSFGDPDIVVHNVGGTLGVSDPFAAIGEWRRVWRLNFEIAVELNAIFLPGMIERQYGRIVALSSLAAVEHRATIAYSVAKTALTAYTRVMARTVAQHGVCMSALIPGTVMAEGSPWAIKREQDPSFVDNYMREIMPTGRFETPEEVADFVTFLCSERASSAVGSVYSADSGQARSYTV